LWSHSLGIVHGVAGDRQQIDRFPLQGALCIQAGQQQEVLHQQPHPSGLALDPPHQALHRSCI
jgi:hypothetical protein